MIGEKITEDEEKSCEKENNVSVEPSPVLEKVPVKMSENTAKQILQTPRSERMRAVRNKKDKLANMRKSNVHRVDDDEDYNNK
jgi:hypothetical protein